MNNSSEMKTIEEKLLSSFKSNSFSHDFEVMSVSWNGSQSKSQADKSEDEFIIKVRRKQIQTPVILDSPVCLPNTIKEETTLTPQEEIYLEDGRINAPFLMKNAEILTQSGEHELARKIYETLIQTGCNTSEALYLKGRCHESEGQFEAATTCYEDSLLYEASEKVYYQLIHLQLSQKHYSSAASAAERALHLDHLSLERQFDLHKTAGNCWLRLHQLEKATHQFHRALEIDPSADDIRSNLGVLFLQSKDLSQARKNFQDAIASNPENHLALAGLGFCHFQHSEFDLAHDYFVQSLEISNNNPPVLYQLIRCAYQIKKFAQTTRIVKEYVDSSVVSVPILFSLAGLEFQLGRMRDARSTTQKVLKLQPDHDGAQRLIQTIDRYGH